MDYSTIDFEKKERIGILSLNRPEVLNALSPRMREELVHCLDHVAGDEDLRVLILTGKGRGFCAGADLNMFKDAYEAFRSGDEHQGFGDIDLPKAFIDFPKPLIAAINGPAVGFGLTVTLTCDIRIASEKAKFGCAFVRVGVTPEFGSSYFLPRLLGYGKAAELAFTARTIDAQEAAQIGLVNRVVGHADLLSECEGMARSISEMPTGAIRMTKQILRHGHHSTLEQALPYEGLVFQHQTRTREHYDAVCRILEQLKSRS
jgi:2-(1,2-epoxy-1,2-dihydrophenyl)acetyl-CoA isomerase